MALKYLLTQALRQCWRHGKVVQSKKTEPRKCTPALRLVPVRDYQTFFHRWRHSPTLFRQRGQATVGGSTQQARLHTGSSRTGPKHRSLSPNEITMFIDQPAKLTPPAVNFTKYPLIAPPQSSEETAIRRPVFPTAGPLPSAAVLVPPPGQPGRSCGSGGSGQARHHITTALQSCGHPAQQAETSPTAPTAGSARQCRMCRAPASSALAGVKSNRGRYRDVAHIITVNASPDWLYVEEASGDANNFSYSSVSKSLQE